MKTAANQHISDEDRFRTQLRRVGGTFAVLLAMAYCLSAAGHARPQAFESAGNGAMAIPLVSVEQWGGTAISPSLKSRARTHWPSRVTLHHAGVPFGREKDPAQHLRNLQKWSRDIRQWADIPYHYVIDLDGRVYEARDVLLAGDTNTGYDTTGHALVMVLGNFEDVQPTESQVEAAVQLSAHLIIKFEMKAGLLASHRDVSAGTSCPGKNFYALLQSGEFQRRVEEALRK